MSEIIQVSFETEDKYEFDHLFDSLEVARQPGRIRTHLETRLPGYVILDRTVDRYMRYAWKTYPLKISYRLIYGSTSHE